MTPIEPTQPNPTSNNFKGRSRTVFINNSSIRAEMDKMSSHPTDNETKAKGSGGYRKLTNGDSLSFIWGNGCVRHHFEVCCFPSPPRLFFLSLANAKPPSPCTDVFMVKQCRADSWGPGARGENGYGEFYVLWGGDRK